MSTRSLLYHAFGTGVVEIEKTEFTNGEIHFYLRTPRERLACSKCRGANVIRKGTVKREFITVPIGPKPVRIHYTVQRLGCRDCELVRQEALSFAVPYKRYTKAFARHALQLSKRMTIKDVAQQLRVGWDLIRDIQYQDLKKKVKGIKLKTFRRLAIDELAIGKGHTYVTIVMDLDSGAAIHIGDGKGGDAVEDFLKRVKRSGAKIDAVAMDMSAAYIGAVQRQLPNAKIVFDHFHVTKLMNDKLTALRRKVFHEASRLGQKAIKGSRWVLVKNYEHLDAQADEQDKLLDALVRNEALTTGYLLKEEFRQFWHQPNKEAAREFLDSWTKRAIASGIHDMSTIAATLRGNRTGLLNYFDHPISTGPLEGFNNKAQLMKRQAYGYRNRHFYKLKLMTLHDKKYALTG